MASLRRSAEEFAYEVGNYGGSLKIATSYQPLTFNRALAIDYGSTTVLGYLFEGLTETSWLTDQVQPALAESWETSDDGLVWTFQLRRGVTWHDGEPFTAEDVEFTFNRIIYNDAIPVVDRSAFEFRYRAENGVWQNDRLTVTATDDYTVQIVLPVPFAPFLRSLSTPIYPQHLLEQHVENGTFESVWDIDTDPREIIGTGPFTISSYAPGERLVLRRNPSYWMTDTAGNTLPYLEEIIHLIVADRAGEREAFLDGSSEQLRVLGADYAELEPLQQEHNFTIHRRGPSFAMTFLAFNMNPGSHPDTGEPFMDPVKLEWFSNKSFRQAVTHSIDRDKIINEVQHGLGYSQWSSTSALAGDFYNPDVQRYEYDPERANEILDEIGWTDRDGDGVREDSAGNRIQFRLVTNADNTERTHLAELLQQFMEAIGLAVDYEMISFGDLIGKLTSSYDWDSLVVGYERTSEPHDSTDLWHSSGILHLWHPNQESPATDWEAEIDDLLITASQELDHATRVAKYHQVQEILAENMPIIYTTVPERLTAVSNVFGNTTPSLFGLVGTWDIRYLYRTDLTDTSEVGPPAEVPTG